MTTASVTLVLRLPVTVHVVALRGGRGDGPGKRMVETVIASAVAEDVTPSLASVRNVIREDEDALAVIDAALDAAEETP